MSVQFPLTLDCISTVSQLLKGVGRSLRFYFIIGRSNLSLQSQYSTSLITNSLTFIGCIEVLYSPSWPSAETLEPRLGVALRLLHVGGRDQLQDSHQSFSSKICVGYMYLEQSRTSYISLHYPRGEVLTRWSLGTAAQLLSSTTSYRSGTCMFATCFAFPICPSNVSKGRHLVGDNTVGQQARTINLTTRLQAANTSREPICTIFPRCQICLEPTNIARSIHGRHGLADATTYTSDEFSAVEACHCSNLCAREEQACRRTLCCSLCW